MPEDVKMKEKELLKISEEFIPSETMSSHLQLVSDQLKLVDEKELEAFKYIYILLCKSGRMQSCSNLNEKIFEEILHSFSPFLIVNISIANILRDIVKSSIEADRMLNRNLEENVEILEFSRIGIIENIKKFVILAKKMNQILINKCDDLIGKVENENLDQRILETANYTKAVAHRNIGDAFRYFAEVATESEESKFEAQENYEKSLQLSQNFLPKALNLQYLNTELNAAVFKCDLCQQHQEAFMRLKTVFEEAKRVVYPLISDLSKGEKVSPYMNDNFHAIQVIFQVYDTNLREWSKLYDFKYDTSEVYYSDSLEDEEDDDDDNDDNSNDEEEEEISSNASLKEKEEEKKLEDQVKNIRI